jgi:hypothetical protein
MSRRVAGLIALDALLTLLVVQRSLQLRDAWERQVQALAVQEQLGAQ